MTRSKTYRFQSVSLVCFDFHFCLLVQLKAQGLAWSNLAPYHNVFAISSLVQFTLTVSHGSSCGLLAIGIWDVLPLVYCLPPISKKFVHKWLLFVCSFFFFFTSSEYAPRVFVYLVLQCPLVWSWKRETGAWIDLAHIHNWLHKIAHRYEQNHIDGPINDSEKHNYILASDLRSNFNSGHLINKINV